MYCFSYKLTYWCWQSVFGNRSRLPKKNQFNPHRMNFSKYKKILFHIWLILNHSKSTVDWILKKLKDYHTLKSTIKTIYFFSHCGYYGRGITINTFYFNFAKYSDFQSDVKHVNKVIQSKISDGALLNNNLITNKHSLMIYFMHIIVTHTNFNICE